jgi:hypothetical protein
MFWFCAALSAAGVLESVICSCLLAEFAGYWLQRLVDRNMLFLTRNQIAQHLLPYGPTQPTRSESDQGATRKRFSLGGHRSAKFRIRFFYFHRVFRAIAARYHHVSNECLATASPRYRLATPLCPRSGGPTGEGEAAFQ